MTNLPKHDERCRQLAELSLQAVGSAAKRLVVQGSPLDTRFASLRGSHWWLLRDCHWCGTSPEEIDTHSYCLRTDGDALDEAVAACGFSVYCYATGSEWTCILDYETTLGKDAPPYQGTGETSRAAKSAALYTAVLGDNRCYE